MSTPRSIGVRLPRIDAEAKVTGRARYAADWPLPGRLYAGILRCPHAHARVIEVDTRAAERLRGVHAVLSRHNTQGECWYEEKSPTFSETCRFAGEEVAAVAADSREALAEAIAAIRVEYERLPFVVDIESAKVRGAARVHDSHPDNLAGEPVHYERGNVAAAFAQADVVIDQTFVTPCVVHNALEPHGCTALWQDGKLLLWVSTQGIFAVRDGIAEKLGLDEEDVRVYCDFMGGGFGAKQIDWKPTLIAALLARQAQRPVQLLLDRRGENLAVGNRNPTVQRVRVAADGKGKLCALDVEIDCGIGAYRAGGETSHVDGIYQTLYCCPNVRTVQRNYYTNTGPSVAFRAPGFAEGAFALEQAIDELARRLRMDPAKLRLGNMPAKDQVEDKPYSSPGALTQCIGAVTSEPVASFDSALLESHVRRGSGLAACVWMAGKPNPPAQVRLRLYRHGALELVTGSQDIGTGTRTIIAQIAADVLGVRVDEIRCEIGDTGPDLVAPTSSGSSTVPTLGPAVAAAAEELCRKLSRMGKRAATPLAEIAGKLDVPYIEAFGECPESDDHVAVRTFGALRAEVEVNTLSGEVRALRLAVAADCGRIINPLLAYGQVAGGATQGLGYVLMEERIADAELGLVVNANLEEYHVPTALDVPLIEHVGIDLPDPYAFGPGAKGLGEPPLIPAAPAIANAVCDAIGVRITEFPITRARVLASLRSEDPRE